jgi:CRISPR-associated exonuclease Cas4
VPDTIAFGDLARAAYCPRQLYYVRRDDADPPPEYEHARDLASRYDELAVASEAALTTFDIAVPPPEFRANLGASLEEQPRVARPDETDAFLQGKDAHGRADKVFTDPLAVSVVTHGDPPEQGVWEPQTVRAVAAAKALSWREEASVERAFVEYPRHGVVRSFDVTTRRKAAYNRALRAARSIDGPPPRLHDDAKCGVCDYRSECGTKTRTLRSLL